jgi:serine/threonine protein kinase/formylglycine-generating enzyme required for sulfatase activity
MDSQRSKSNTPITVDFLRDRIARDRDAGDLRPLGDYLAVFSAEETLVAQAYFSVCQESAAPKASRDETVVNRSHKTTRSTVSFTVGGAATPVQDPGGADQVGPYRLIKELGRGGQGAVHLAEDTRLGRRVALKLLTGVGSLTEANLRRFHREAELASKLDHPGICAVYDFGAFEGVPYIAMRFVEGETLAKRIGKAKQPAVQPGASEHIAIDDDEPPTLSDTLAESGSVSKVETLEVVRVMEKAARAIHAAHEAGVIHRDLKPGNIMVDATGEPVVLDFGLARDLEGDGDSLTKSGDFLGTPAYMSPEQIASGHIHLDRRSDVYSLGVTLYECLTLRRPFDAPTREALYQSILSKEPPDPRKFNKIVSADLKVVLECALNKDRDKRYVTAEALANDLRRVIELKPIQAKPISPFGRMVRWGRRNPAVAAMTAAAFLSLAIGLVATLIQKGRADQKAEEARKSAIAATERENDWRKLADLTVLDELSREADHHLWPAVPERAPAIEGWLAKADDVLSRLPAHVASLAAIRQNAQPYDDAAKQRDRESFVEENERLALIEPEIERLRREPDAADRLAKLEAEHATLEAKISKRVTWSFASPEDRFQHDSLALLVSRLEELGGAAQGPRATRKDLADRLELAKTMRKRTIDDHAAAWKDAIAAISRAPAYRGLRIKEQVGLIPLGPDPTSGLFEFTEIQTGTPAKRGPGGKIVPQDDMALVFVLIPGGTFAMGAQSADPDQPNFDGEARADESPVHEVVLGAFFLSKYEMTQGQWLKFTGRNPSLNAPPKRFGEKVVGLTDPVEQVTWNTCTDVLGRLALVLPTEAQWEYAARAGTTSRFWCGDDPKDLETHANVADQTFKKFGGQGPAEAWEDGYATHAPVGNYPANRFGLHDVIGNVLEWCRDSKTHYSASVQAGDGLRTAVVQKSRIIRGGSLSLLATQARSAFRGDQTPDKGTGNIGVRPARALQP